MPNNLQIYRHADNPPPGDAASIYQDGAGDVWFVVRTATGGYNATNLADGTAKFTTDHSTLQSLRGATSSLSWTALVTGESVTLTVG